MSSSSVPQTQEQANGEEDCRSCQAVQCHRLKSRLMGKRTAVHVKQFSVTDSRAGQWGRALPFMSSSSVPHTQDHWLLWQKMMHLYKLDWGRMHEVPIVTLTAQ